MVTYLDSSFLVSLYRPDIHTPVAAEEMDKLSESPPITPLQIHEVRNAIRLGVFQKIISQRECKEALQLFHRDIQNEILRPLSVQWNLVFREAERIGSRFTESAGIRAADLLHLAIAVVLGAARFRTFDQRQARLAKALGLE
jgi:predicted nucleic acid-binding protein